MEEAKLTENLIADPTGLTQFNAILLNCIDKMRFERTHYSAVFNKALTDEAVNLNVKTKKRYLYFYSKAMFVSFKNYLKENMKDIEI